MTVRLEGPLGGIVQKIAQDDDRSIGYVLRQLIVEALQARKLVPKGATKWTPELLTTWLNQYQELEREMAAGEAKTVPKAKKITA